MKTVFNVGFLAILLILTSCGRHYSTTPVDANNSAAIPDCSTSDVFGAGSMQKIENSECDLHGSYCVRPRSDWGTVEINKAVYPIYCLETH